MILKKHIGVALFFLTATCSIVSAEPPADYPEGRWLVDRARTYALNTANPSEADGDYLLIWLEAASTLSPSFPDSYLWQYDIHRRMNHSDKALKALEAYCKLAPENYVARLDQIALGFEEKQTAETRMAYCQEHLEQSDLPPVIASDLLLRMADLHLRLGDDTKALEAATRAAETFPYNLAASMMALELGSEANNPVERIKLLLSRVSANPARGDSIYMLAQYLDQLGLHGDAIPLYVEAIDDFKRRNPEIQPPDTVLLALARSYCDSGQHEKAKKVCETLLTNTPQNLPARILQIRVLRSLGEKEAEQEAIEATSQVISDNQKQAMKNRLPLALGAMAWFYTEYKPEPDKAIELAREAHRIAPDDPEVNCILGLALIANKNAEEAANLLDPLAQDNAAAAVGLAKAKLELGYKDAAIDLLRKSEKIRSTGLVHEFAVKMLTELGQEPASAPERSEVKKLLNEFNRNVLDFDDRPEKALKFQAGFFKKQFAYGDPMECGIRIVNIADYPITLGPDAMVNPEVLVSVNVAQGDAPPLVGFTSVSLYRRHVLKPSESITVRQSLCIGPFYDFMQSCPQRDTSLTFSLTLDPMKSKTGLWQSRLTNYKPVRVSTRRSAVNASQNGLNQLFQMLENGSVSKRIQVVHALAGLIAEKKASAEQALDHSAFRIDDSLLQNKILLALADPDPRVRAHVLDSLRMLELNNTIIASASAGLSDANWVVRLLAFDLFGVNQGIIFKPVAERMGQSDPNELVRKLANLFLKLIDVPQVEQVDPNDILTW